ncbi:high frequency lysogenization protein HflD [Pseudoteredinibacter isoporae]|uniref:High frequency lysogenization protein HflD homolog n=1 Tax=Pseudoteredinibacter isoporae TaxID=570281 RepID=A0A7X0JTL1_9GAMM|nr:high frequency lysogenization protein HflD [Pseudoteredinibacter isoporae]MBB6521609.1 high frequency lysogenization protein [Pseudoteredinibacter isoporae]NHO87163.1 high frequency lysogenization protein HflD [Pseudoteredinibacter isoporae]NIB22987.1 high frequency lysogenization protein HflD [Pseudoteredinibacter isoporae]
MAKNWQDISLALAGVFQSTALVDQIARTGYLPTEPYQCAIQSLFEQNPSDTQSVYGGAHGVDMGLRIMAQLLDNKVDREHPNTMRYVMGILHLQKKLSKDAELLAFIGERLSQAKRQADHFDNISHDSVIANLAGIYSESLSHYKFRIQVMGDAAYLQQQRVAEQVRALLLASVRSATLWRQVGGSRLDILFHRKRLLKAAHLWLNDIN